MAQNEIEGLGPVLDNFKKINNPRKQKNTATRAARKAMNIVRKAAADNAKAIDDPESPNRIWKNIATRAGRTRGTGMVLMRVGVRGGAQQYAKTKANVRKGRAGKTYATAGSKKNPGGDTFYWRYQELGTSKMPAQPFLRIALWNNTERVNDEFATFFGGEITKEISKK